MKQIDNHYDMLFFLMIFIAIAFFLSLFVKSKTFSDKQSIYTYLVLSTEYDGYTNEYNISDQCVYFIDEHGKNVVICGDFAIKKTD